MNLEAIHTELYEISMIAACAIRATTPPGNTEAPDLYLICLGICNHLENRHPDIALSPVTRQTLERLTQPPVTLSYN